MKLQIVLFLLIGIIAALNEYYYEDPYEYKDTDSNDYYYSIDAGVMKTMVLGMLNTTLFSISNAV